MKSNSLILAAKERRERKEKTGSLNIAMSAFGTHAVFFDFVFIFVFSAFFRG